MCNTATLKMQNITKKNEGPKSGFLNRTGQAILCCGAILYAAGYGATHPVLYLQDTIGTEPPSPEVGQPKHLQTKSSGGRIDPGCEPLIKINRHNNLRH